MTDSPCKKCGNTIGFTFGTCIECGWNYIDGSYTWIRVYREDLDPRVFRDLARLHDDRIETARKIRTAVSGLSTKRDNSD